MGQGGNLEDGTERLSRPGRRPRFFEQAPPRSSRRLRACRAHRPHPDPRRPLQPFGGVASADAVHRLAAQASGTRATSRQFCRTAPHAVQGAPLSAYCLGHVISASASAPFREGAPPWLRPRNRRPGPIHPGSAFLLASTVPLFLGGLVSDLAYGNTAQPQCNNFAVWLIGGAMVFTGIALLGALITLLLGRRRWGGPVTPCSADNCLRARVRFLRPCSARWWIIPTAPICSAVVILFALAAAIVGFWHLRSKDVR